MALLEKLITGYYLVFAAQGIELTVPAAPAGPCLVRRSEGLPGLSPSQNADAFATTRGYYHPTWNAVVAYDARSTDKQRRAARTQSPGARSCGDSRRRSTGSLPRAKLRVTLAGESARTLGRAEALALLDRLEREVRREELLLDLERRAINDGTATHEMIHLLAANSGLLPRHDAFPIWLQEGLAMQFEVIRGGRWAGIGRVHDIRLADWRRIQPPPRLEPLVRDAGYGRGYQRDLYAQAWSLVYFLRSQHPEQFLTYLDLLRSPDATLAERPRPTATLDRLPACLWDRSRAARERLARIHVLAPDASGTPRPNRSRDRPCLARFTSTRRRRPATVRDKN